MFFPVNNPTYKTNVDKETIHADDKGVAVDVEQDVSEMGMVPVISSMKEIDDDNVNEF